MRVSFAPEIQWGLENSVMVHLYHFLAIPQGDFHRKHSDQRALEM